MFNKDTQFYPTKKSTVKKLMDMMGNRLGACKYILEPSAGTLNIVESFTKIYQESYFRRIKDAKDFLVFDCIEVDQDRQHIIMSKGYNLLWDDFTTFEPTRFYDLIIMNPPFNNGCEHLLKAISIQERIGGQICAILNAETLRNPYSQNRKHLLELLHEYAATIEYSQGEFSDSERKTDVEVALIYIDIPMKDTKTLFDKDMERSNIELDYYDQNVLTEKESPISRLVRECRVIKESAIRLYQEQLKISKSLENYGMDGKIQIAYGNYSTKPMNVNEFIDTINLEYWNKLIDETDLKNKLPSKLRETFTYNMDRQRNIDFNMQSAWYFAEELMANIPVAYEDTVAKVFDDCTRKYHYSDSQWSKSRHLYNGWKTNDAFKVNKKVIIPVSYWDYGLPKILLDLNLIFENLGGFKDDLHKLEGFADSIKRCEKKIESRYFVLDVYQKGTIHIHFKDEKLLDRFNFLASKGKKWLSADVGKKPFKDLTKEEQESILSFGIDVCDYDLNYLGDNTGIKLLT